MFKRTQSAVECCMYLLVHFKGHKKPANKPVDFILEHHFLVTNGKVSFHVEIGLLVGPWCAMGDALFGSKIGLENVPEF